MRNLSHKIGPTLQPVFIGKKLEQDLKPKEAKPSIVNQQCVVYHIVCALCGADYVSYTARHLFQRVAEDLAIGKLFHDAHDRSDLLNESQFKILNKCQGKFDFLVFEILYIKKLIPNLNVKADSIRAKLFVDTFPYFSDRSGPLLINKGISSLVLKVIRVIKIPTFSPAIFT